MQRLSISFLTILLAGCTTTFGVIENQPIKSAEKNTDNSYSLAHFMQREVSKNSPIMLAFSGGGTRAAALSYGVLKALRDTPIQSAGKTIRLLDEVSNISSVSGGSFTAAYYGLHGDRTFDDFETVFLRRNIAGGLKKTLLNPRNWVDKRGRTELSIDLYQQQVFKGATFADMLRPGAPLIIINASDLSKGVRFSFIQEYFDLLCSELRTFPIARAVAASSAVPVVFSPVVIKNHANCNTELPSRLKDAMTRSQNRSQLRLTINGLDSYSDKQGRQYAHFVDGGITDNLGLRAIYDVLELGGGAKRMAQILKIKPVKRFVIISVDASTTPQNLMDKTRRHPSLLDSANAMSDVQLQRYNIATIDVMKKSMRRWADQLSTPQHRVEPYFIQLRFKDIQDDTTRKQLNEIPTNFNLPNDEVDLLIKTGSDLLYSNTEFRRLLADINRQ